MSEADQVFLSASADFINLCQAQAALLTTGLGAVWSAIYLTVESQPNGTKQLIPIVVYPERDINDRDSQVLAGLTASWNRAEDSNPPLQTTTENFERDFSTLTTQRQLKSFSRRKQVVLPLIYKNAVMGLLVTKREDRDWNRQEVSQIKKVAQTIAIASTLDRQQEYHRSHVETLQHFIANEQRKIDDLLHQLRNPLTALRTFSKLLIKRLLPEDRNRGVAENILQQGDRLQDLLQQFEGESSTKDGEFLAITNDISSNLLTEREENNNFLLPVNALTTEIVFLKDLLLPLIETTAALAEEKGINFTAKIPEFLPPVQGNLKALREVFSNLFDNAIKYTPQGGSVEIEAGLQRQEQDIIYQGIAIRDTGYGIPPADRGRLFERSYRGIQAGGNIQGTGLGLSIAKELVEKIQGSIEFISPNPLLKNSESVGTVFTVWLKTCN
jgi:signal transduction histidine kinase